MKNPATAGSGSPAAEGDKVGESVMENTDNLGKDWWITISCLFLVLLFAVLIVAQLLYLYCVYAIAVALACWLLMERASHEVHRISIWGLVLVDVWFVYALLPWGIAPGFWADLISSIFAVGLVLYYQHKKEIWLFYLQLVIAAFCPTNQIEQLTKTHVYLTVAMFALWWFGSLAIDHSSKTKSQVIHTIMIATPIFRLQTIPMLIYTGLVCTVKLAVFWSSKKTKYESVATEDEEEQAEEAGEEEEDEDYADVELQPVQTQQPPVEKELQIPSHQLKLQKLGKKSVTFAALPPKSAVQLKRIKSVPYDISISNLARARRSQIKATAPVAATPTTMTMQQEDPATPPQFTLTGKSFQDSYLNI